MGKKNSYEDTPVLQFAFPNSLKGAKPALLHTPVV